MLSFDFLSRRRWQMALLIASAIAISYFDRQTLPVAIGAIQRQIPLSNTQFSELQALFLLAYALMYVGGGKLVDVLGTRRGFALIMLWWSLACASQGLATSFPMLAASLFLLGMGEGGGFPAATKAVAEWFPVGERSTAMGIMNAGTAVGAVIAPPAIAIILSLSNWRWVFFLAGAVGLAWTGSWLLRYFLPADDPHLSPEERAEISEVMAPRPEHQVSVPWLRLFAYRETIGLVLAKTLSDAAWYFYIFWFPKYLYDVRGFDTKQVGYYAWVPYAAAGVGCLAGGWFSSHLIHRRHSLNAARKVVLGASAAVMPLIAFVTHVPVGLAIVLFSIAFFGQQSWSTLVMILPADIFPRAVVGSVAGLVGFGGAMGGMVFGLIVGRLLDAGVGYGPVFIAVGTFHLIAFCVILITVRDVRPLPVNAEVAVRS